MNTRRAATRAALAVLAAATLILAGCATTSRTAPATPVPTVLAAKGASFGDFPGRPEGAALSAFARESLPTFESFALSNGIPVVVKRNTANRVQHLALYLRGGAAANPPASAGLEALALRTMARGSTSYPYAAIQALLDETSSAIGAEVSLDWSSYSLTTLDKYFDRIFPVWADSLVRPAFAKEDFDQVLSESRLALQTKEQNPWTKAGLVINDEFFKGHPYAAAPDGTKASLDAASLEAVRAWHSGPFSSNRMFVVAVGDFDPTALRARLEAALSSIPDRKFPLPPRVPAFAQAGKGRLVKHEFAQSRGIGYLRGDFAAPGTEDADYMPLGLGMKMLSDLLFNVVRDKYGASYSPSAYIRSFEANYGSLAIFKTKVSGKVKGYMDEAVAELAAGKVVSVDPGVSDGKQPRMALADSLPVYKALFTNELYEKQQTNAAIASRIAQSVISSGDFRSYLLDVDRIAAVTPEQVAAALRKYLLEGSLTWVVIGSKDQLLPTVDVDFDRFH